MTRNGSTVFCKYFCLQSIFRIFFCIFGFFMKFPIGLHKNFLKTVNLSHSVKKIFIDTIDESFWYSINGTQHSFQGCLLDSPWLEQFHGYWDISKIINIQSRLLDGDMYLQINFYHLFWYLITQFIHLCILLDSQQQLSSFISLGTYSISIVCKSL